jgi:hypothetical protein
MARHALSISLLTVDKTPFPGQTYPYFNPLSPVLPNHLQQYMMKVQEQKHGTGEKAFDFLNEPSKKPAAMQADEDMGFDEMQMRVLEDTEQVRGFTLFCCC